MNTKLIRNLLSGLITLGVCHNVWAQPAGQTNYFWTAAGNARTWSQGANWTSLPGNSQIVPPTDGTTFQINLYDPPATHSLIPITITNTDSVNINDAIFGPLWGQTLDVYGMVNCGFGEFLWGDNNSGTTTLNIRTNGYVSLRDTMAVGTAWWFPGGANVSVNVYSNAQLNVTWMQFGGHLNIYGGTVSVTNGFNTGGPTTPVFNGGVDTDATRAINIITGSTLVLPAGYTATVNDWINRGILLVYGVPGDGAEIVIDEANTNWPSRTVVTTTATNANPIVAVNIQVPRTNLFVGGLEQAQVYADYSITTNVNITTTPGTGLIYQSTATNVVTVTAAGRVRATGPGTALVKAIVGTVSNSVLVTVAHYTNTASLVHRYSFSESAGSATTADSIPGNSPTWDGTLNGSATLGGGQLTLNELTGDYVQFPAGILTNMDAVTIETWVSFGTISNWAVLYTFGDSTGPVGFDYISFQPHTAPATVQAGIKNATFEQDPNFTPVLDNHTNVHIVAVYHPEAGFCSIYTNGMLAGINSSITITMADAMASGDPLNYIGHSLWSADPYLNATMDEFRIYDGPLSAGQIRADAALGPNQLIGTNTNVSVAASRSGNNLRISWPTSSALVTLMTSPKLGPGATWTPVNTPLTVIGGNYQAAISLSGTTQFFQLAQ